MICRLPFCHRYHCVYVVMLLAACAGSTSLRSGASVDDVATPPQLLNREEVDEAIAVEYPPQLRAAGVGGVVRLSLLVGRDGIPTDLRILQTSGYDPLDEAAARVARVLRFDPATDHDGDPVQVWASFPIVFRVP